MASWKLAAAVLVCVVVAVHSQNSRARQFPASRFSGAGRGAVSSQQKSPFPRRGSSARSSPPSRSGGSSFGRRRPAVAPAGGRSSLTSSRRQQTTGSRATGRTGAAQRTPARLRGTDTASSRAAGNRGAARGTAATRGRPQVKTAAGRGRSPARGGAQRKAFGGRGRTPVTGGVQKKKLVTQSPKVNYKCPQADGFFQDTRQCDKYYQCKEGVASEHMCPDGLLFHPNRTYPCVYPVEADCGTRSAQQEPQPTEECPRQFATFKAAEDRNDCGAFTKCINGRAYRSACPESLAFDEGSLNCEWADVVEGCDAPGYLGFRCEQRDFGPDEVGEFTREPHPSDCTKYYVCINKEDGSVQPRLQGCPEPAVFDREKGECNDKPEEVPGCSDAIPSGVVAAFRQRQQDETERREARLAALKAKLTG